MYFIGMPRETLPKGQGAGILGPYQEFLGMHNECIGPTKYACFKECMIQTAGIMWVAPGRCMVNAVTVHLHTWLGTYGPDERGCMTGPYRSIQDYGLRISA